MRRPRFGSAPIFVQVLGLVLLSLVAAQTVNLAVVLTLPDPPPAGFTVAEAARALQGETVTTRDGRRLRAVLRAGPPADRAADRHAPLEALVRDGLAQSLRVAPARLRVTIDGSAMHLRRQIRRVAVRRHGLERAELFVTVTADPGRPPPPGRPVPPALADSFMFPPFSAALERADGRWLTVEPERPWLSARHARLLLWFALSVLLLTPLAWWVARRLARPIHAFAAAAERLGADPNAPPLAPSGPREVRLAAAALNDMQDKLARHLAERTAMIAAIAHDLRTPLTRLRFRAEAAPEVVRERMAADIEQMDAMVRSALAFVRGETAPSERVRLDLAALVGSVVDDLVETGAAAEFTPAGELVLCGDPLGLKRLTANLVENAVKFGGRARAALWRDGRHAVLTVEDDGPGLPAAELERVFEPFYRADAARGAETGGVGLGLAVARSIARAHGGDVALANRTGGGLRATVRLPL
jgi:signal transduction histidine kinase